MCTVSWSLRGNGYRLYFNRDERKSRPIADRPKEIEWRGTRLIAPIDPQGGGSWIASSEQGTTAFLLNYYAATIETNSSGQFRTRGEIPLAIAAAPEWEGRLRRIEGFATSDYRPFLVGFVNPGSPVRAYSWNGRSLERLDLKDSIVTTSSFRSCEVESYRQELYKSCVNKGRSDWAWKNGLQYHLDMSHEDAAFNPSMSREDSETHCISVVTVDEGSLEFDYWERTERSNQFELVTQLGFE